MIKNIWDITTFYCGHNHKEPVKLQIQQGINSLFYACPKYKKENRSDDERVCANRLNLINAQKIIEYYSDLIEKEGFEKANITGATYNFKTIHTKVIKHTLTQLDIEILDTKAIEGVIG